METDNNYFDILILSNGPGEITTWVFPVVKQLHHQLTENWDKIRISLVLSPCPNATGRETEIASKYPEIDRIQSAQYFWDFLLWGKTFNDWDWYKKGIIIFLGGDQFYTVIIAKRLGYSSLVYAEWDARWYRYIDHFAVMNENVIDKLPTNYHNKCTIVGDLMADVPQENDSLQSQSPTELIGLLPGSKPAKLTQGVPFTLAIAEYIHKLRPQTKFIIPVAPTINVDILGKYANPKENPIIKKLGGVNANLVKHNMGAKQQIFLETSGGLKIELITEFPCYKTLKKCQICLTTVGANTAQLGSLGVPMIVLIPTYQLDAMKSWDGLPGLLVNLPFLGTNLAKLINWLVVQYSVKNKRLYSWPNLWAKKEIVPELIGYLKVEEIGDMVLNYLDNPELLTEIKHNLMKVRGDSGAAKNIANIVMSKLKDNNN